jgi:hypothetical protein
MRQIYAFLTHRILRKGSLSKAPGSIAAILLLDKSLSVATQDKKYGVSSKSSEIANFAGLLASVLHVLLVGYRW